VLGGAGYTQDWLVEKLYRDNRLNMIHEGTHGIQGLDLLGRKILADQGAGMLLLLTRIASTAQRAVTVPAFTDIAPSTLELGSALAQAVLPLSDLLKAEPKQADVVFANATLLLDALGTVVVSWLSLDHALAAHQQAHPLAPIWRSQAQYLHRYELPAVSNTIALLKSADRTCVDVDLGQS
jgi:hypothetical protein